jgi:hypothetical protein
MADGYRERSERTVTILLADLVSRLSADIPAVSGVPSAAQYSQAVKDAVADLSRRASVPRVATLPIVAGTAAYALPVDFQALIRLAQIGVPYPAVVGNWEIGSSDHGGAFVTAAGLVPFSGSYREQVTVSGGTLTIYPTPLTSADRSLVYAAGDALVDDGYPTLTDDRAAIALLLAKATCLDRIVLAASGSAGKLRGLGYEIDGSLAQTSQRAEAGDLRTQYLAAVASLTAGSGGLGR